MPMRNEDCFSRNPGKIESMDCKVCGSVCDVKRNVYGCCGWGSEAVLHDQFTCPHADKKWHIQVRMLKSKAKQTPSRRIEEILLDEAETILATRQETKDVGSGKWGNLLM